ncbi:MAG: hypothetical protein H0V62_05165 [Gammaproteobacteria bacterium]|nr:hypothetical protein [Gammaproteobacteria bacterium]
MNQIEATASSNVRKIGYAIAVTDRAIGALVAGHEHSQQPHPAGVGRGFNGPSD